ncbi:hypothetical protein [Staphylococcus pseudintermedius]|uniref:hypothetical protein n=1 Tax=Staphylococcus pseudintermedius TaxID=283734 RepID=UPI001378943F|nr:hypothetical protein [Staphylococcus pseudintermedius]
MKIKVEKEMTLPQLIEWAWENDVKGKTFTSNREREVKFYNKGAVEISRLVASFETFTVETVEEITEDTIIPRLVAIYDVSGQRSIIQHKQKSISDILNDYAVAFYMFNDDMTMTLIWKDGGWWNDR